MRETLAFTFACGVVAGLGLAAVLVSLRERRRRAQLERSLASGRPSIHFVHFRGTMSNEMWQRIRRS